MKDDLIKKLKFQNTAILLLLTFITLGIYMGYYIYRQSMTINSHLEKKSKINEEFYLSIFLLTILSPIVLLVIILCPLISRNTVNLLFGLSILNTIIDQVLIITILLWVFSFRDKINFLLKAQVGSPLWFNGVLTFFLGIFYLNYKINSISPENNQEKKSEEISVGIQTELDDALANYYLGESYFKLGRKDQALDLWKKALSLTKDEKLKGQIEKKLAENRN